MEQPARFLPFILVSGGCRSGKSAYAQQVAEAYAPQRLYVATAVPRDEEMRERVRTHQAARGRGWRTLELPQGRGLELPALLARDARPGEAVLFDCLTLWLAAIMDGDKAPPRFPTLCAGLLDALWSLPCPVVLVTNEVGMGVVPESAAGRAFRDMAGLAAQRAAALAQSVVLVACGLPLSLKGALPCLSDKGALPPVDAL